MERTIQDVISDLLQQIKEYGSKEPTVQLYKNVCQSLISHCNKKRNEVYIDQIPSEMLGNAERCYENGIHCYEYYRLNKRTIRLLDIFARTGKTDFERTKGKPKKYVPSPEHQDLIGKILAENRLVNDAWIEMDRVMRHFFCFLEDISVAVPDLEDNAFLEFIKKASETKQGTMYRVIRAMRLVSEYMKEHHMAELKMDFAMIPTKSAPIRVIAPYSRDEISRIMASTDIGTPLGLRDRAIMLLAFETGLRAIDIIKLCRSDIEWRKAEICILQSKTSAPLSLPLNGTAMNAVADYILKARPESDSPEVFLCSKSPNKPFASTCSLDGVIEKYCALAGVEKKPFRSFHSLRRSFATELSAEGIPLPSISQMLGHKNINESHPYLSYDRPKTLFCALGFEGIPIAGGIYAATMRAETSATAVLEGGDGA